jgi:RimJ/RimL family protein N-acetyltransferase
VVRLVAVTRDDRDRIRRWLTDTAIHGWWGTPSSVEAEIAIAHDTPNAICRMIAVDGVTIGYAHALDAGLLEPAGRSGADAGLWQCSFLIGSEAHRGHGLGAAALDNLTGEVFAATLALGCEIRVPVRSERAVREIEGIGFRWHRVERDQTLGPVWIMRRERASA